MTAHEIYALLTTHQKCELLDFADDDGTSAPSWGHDLGLLDADADYQGEETGYVDQSTLSELGSEVVKLCQIWWPIFQEHEQNGEEKRSVWYAGSDLVQRMGPYPDAVKAWKALELTAKLRTSTGRIHAPGGYVWPEDP